MSARPYDVSVVIPVLNEEGAIGGLVSELRRRLESLALSFEVVVVDGGSSDATRAKAELAGARVLVQRRPGYGAALAEGFEAARGEYILTMDGDGSHSPEAVPALWARRAEAEVVVGSRLVSGGGSDQTPAHRVWLSKALNAFFRAVLAMPVRDSSSGYRLYRAQSLAGIRVDSQGFDAQQSILLGLMERGGRAVEVPIRYVWRKEGISKAKVGVSGRGYLRLAWRRLRGLLGGRSS